ncbi:hypothetical protein [Rhizobium leguminosarum]|uniref:hypothetical protein n=1 Tax=Rhizobium leguminosarum TaxID=384 RepID=UPI00140F72F8|nr:hypothetical protein [Rhizobium leguminosarum]QIO60472.1 hypothetical protein HA463_23390 [Rhizobium leguminosarum bv. trifolii]
MLDRRQVIKLLVELSKFDQQRSIVEAAGLIPHASGRGRERPYATKDAGAEQEKFLPSHCVIREISVMISAQVQIQVTKMPIAHAAMMS